jgi:hypothetical protein
MPPTVQASVGTTVDCYWRADTILSSAARRGEGRTPILKKKSDSRCGLELHASRSSGEFDAAKERGARLDPSVA